MFNKNIFKLFKVRYFGLNVKIDCEIVDCNKIFR